jgi:taurine dioxygenase
MPEISYRPLTKNLGAQVLGLDITRPIDQAIHESLQQAINQYGVLLLRGQKSEPWHLRRLAESFGPIDAHPAAKYAVKDVPDVIILSNGSDEKGEPIGVRDIGQFWHTDGSYLPTPHAYTVLQGVAIPERNGVALGDTIFASITAAYDSLPADMKTRLEDLKVVHSYSYRLQIRRKTATGPIGARGEGSPDVLYPAILTHPISGRKILYVDEGYCTRIVGMPEAEGRVLLAELLAHTTKPEFLYHHVWQKNDILIWDNPSTLHNAVKNYEPGELRLMHRVMTKFRDWVPGRPITDAA